MPFPFFQWSFPKPVNWNDSHRDWTAVLSWMGVCSLSLLFPKSFNLNNSLLCFSFLFSNQLIGTVPTEIGQLSSLTRLYVLYYFFSKIISICQLKLPTISIFQWSFHQPANRNHSHRDWTAWSYVSWIYVSYLICFTPESFNLNNPYLFFSTLNNNQLTGTIPTEIGQLSFLWELSLLFFFFLSSLCAFYSYFFQLSRKQSADRNHSHGDWTANLSFISVSSLIFSLH